MKEWKKNIRKVVPYVPGEQPKQQDIIKLNTNENPYPPSPSVYEAMKRIDPGRMRLYPDPSCRMLVNGLASYHGLDAGQIFVGVGSDDVLAMAFMTFFNSEKPILFPDITYSFYQVWADLLKIPFKTPALDEDFQIRAEDYYRENGGVIFPNPNAPTGIGEGLDFVKCLLENNPDSIVIIDEAYIDFGGTSCLPLLQQYENLVVVQTMSKSRSLAGLRVGYAIASSELIAALEAVKNSYNSYTMDMLTLEAATASVQDDAYFRRTCQKVIDTRERAKEEFQSLGFTVLPSQANFLLVSHPTKSAQFLFEQLRKKKIFVRYFSQPRVSHCLRVTVGTDLEMQKLFAALRVI